MNSYFTQIRDRIRPPFYLFLFFLLLPLRLLNQPHTIWPEISAEHGVSQCETTNGEIRTIDVISHWLATEFE